MSGKDVIETIREVFTYINRFRGKIFVIKIDCGIIDNPYFPVFLKDLATLHSAGIRIIIIPGARERIDEILGQYGIDSEYKSGIRITGLDAIPFVKMAAFDVSNRIMTGLSGHGINALVGNWIRARSMGVIDGVDFKYTGKVDKVLTAPLNNILNDDFIPIIPSIGWNPSGTSYNLSSDELAVEAASALGAEKLFFITSEEILKAADYNIPAGVIPAPDGRLSRMDEDAARKFLAMNRGYTEGSVKVVEKALEGIKYGIKRVHLINGNGNGGILSEIFSNQGIGTMIYRNEFDRIRKMDVKDIPEVLRIMRPFEKKGVLVPRTRNDLRKLSGDFVVYEIDGIVHGCAALHIHKDKIGEIAAVAVDSEYEKMGIGKKLVEYLIKNAEEQNLKLLFLLTTRSSDWFESLGFFPGSLEDLPDDKRNSYNFNRNSRIMLLKPAESREQRQPPY